jgi:hypothetical protein
LENIKATSRARFGLGLNLKTVTLLFSTKATNLKFTSAALDATAALDAMTTLVATYFDIDR